MTPWYLLNGRTYRQVAVHGYYYEHPMTSAYSRRTHVIEAKTHDEVRARNMDALDSVQELALFLHWWIFSFMCIIYRSSCVYRTCRFIHISRMTMCQGFIHAPPSSFPSTHVLSIIIKFHSGQMSTITMNGVGRGVASAQDKLSRWRLVTSSRHHMYDIQPALLLCRLSSPSQHLRFIITSNSSLASFNLIN